MALKPDELLRSRDEGNRKLLNELEIMVDGLLRDRFVGERVTVNLLAAGKGVPNKRVLDWLVALYREAGWRAEIDRGSDQREGEWCNLCLDVAP